MFNIKDYATRYNKKIITSVTTLRGLRQKCNPKTVLNFKNGRHSNYIINFKEKIFQNGKNDLNIRLSRS